MKLWNIIWIGVVLVCGVGCSDFLDVQPKDKQSEEQLFGRAAERQAIGETIIRHERRFLYRGERDI